jgi:hypothetical protein
MVFTHNPEQSIVGVVHTHAPATQALPPLHASPHPPQLALSVCVSTQLPAHAVVAPGQLAIHADAPHTVLVAHIVMHAPQLSGSSVRSAQTPAQSVVPFVHWHMPLTHALPPAHVTPQAPQFAGSLSVLTHRPPQSTRPPRHAAPESMHAPSTHTEPGPQLLPQLPQSPWLVKMSVQLPPHTISPAAHWHVPPAQVWPPMHVVPHVPQFALSLAVSTQALLQFVSPVPQAPAHAPEEQTSPAAHA